MTPETLSASAGVLLSIALNYIPGLNTQFDRLSANAQRAVMALLLAFSAVGLALWTCTGPDALSISSASLCSDAGGGVNWRAVVQSFVFALMANQAADRISPKPREIEKAVEEAKPAPPAFRSLRG